MLPAFKRFYFSLFRWMIDYQSLFSFHSINVLFYQCYFKGYSSTYKSDNSFKMNSSADTGYAFLRVVMYLLETFDSNLILFTDLIQLSILLQ